MKSRCDGVFIVNLMQSRIVWVENFNGKLFRFGQSVDILMGIILIL